MSREKRYVFKMMLTLNQEGLINNTVDECIGIESGEKIVAEYNRGDGSITVCIIPPNAALILGLQLKDMRERTDVDTLGLIG